MFPDDSTWFDNSGNEEVTHEWTNAVQLSTDCIKGDGSTGTFPAPTGTTLPWGGGRFVIAKSNTKVEDTKDWIVDASLDYRNRVVVVFAFGAYNAADLLPGEASYSSVGGPGYPNLFDSGFNHFYTESGSATGNPPGDPYLVLCATADDITLFCDSVTFELVLHNEVGGDIYPFIFYWVSDQFPTRT